MNMNLIYRKQRSELTGRLNDRPLDTLDQMSTMVRGTDGRRLPYAKPSLAASRHRRRIGPRRSVLDIPILSTTTLMNYAN